jgi:GH35 family endo-1,4-beta-xylanase
MKRVMLVSAGFVFLHGAVSAGVSEAYRQAWNDPALVKRINEGIERNRKGTVKLRVVDAAGQPLAGAVLTLRQKTHDFLFGCNAFVLGQLETPERNRQYEETFTRICNFATVPIYWKGTEPKQGVLRYQEGGEDIWRRPPADRFIPFGKKYGLTLKAHPMLWHEHNPDWLPKDPAALKALYRKRFKELAERYAKDIAIWEVTNESTGCHKTYPLFSEDRAYVAWALQEAAPLFGDGNRLMINDFTQFNERLPAENAYYKQLKSLLDQGLRINGIGLQFHIWFEPRLMERHLAGERYLPARLLDVYEAFAAFNRPLYITEITVPTPQGPDGEAVQAEVVRNLYRLWFSAPAMAGVTYWNLGDSMAHDKENTAAAGLIDRDLKPKPAYRALDELINRDWHSVAEGVAGADGTLTFRGFYGAYEGTVKQGGATRTVSFHLSKGGAAEQRVVFN